jgi:hypothetical protein
MLLAHVADQSQLDYLALENVVDAMKELADNDNKSTTNNDISITCKIQPLNNKKTKMPVVVDKKIKQAKKGAYEIFDTISKSHLSARLWLKARRKFIEYMFNQLTDAGKAKGSDENIIRDFGDLKYYLNKSVQEAEGFYDSETKAYFQFVDASLDLIRGLSLQECLNKLHECLLNFSASKQLSNEGLVNYLRAAIFKNDINFAFNILAYSNNEKKISVLYDEAQNFLLNIQNLILNQLKLNGGESIESYLDKEKSYFDTVSNDTLQNVYNSLYHYLIHAKLRLGSCLMLKSSLNDSLNHNNSNKLWQNALMVLASGIELNRVIADRSISLEIELKYRYAHCIRELFITRQIGTISDVFDAYNSTLNLIHNSNHDLNMVRNCYLELGAAFISTYDPEAIGYQLDKPKKNALQTSRAVDAAVVLFSLAIKTSNAMKEKTLLPGHESIKNMPDEFMSAKNTPYFVSNDILAFYIFAERKRIYRDEIEAEVLMLAPEFDPKHGYKSYDDKVKQLKQESDKSITLIHLINYQSKLQNLSSMRNLNTLKNGKNRFVYSEFLTIGFSPVLKNVNQTSARLYTLHQYLKNNLTIYREDCMTPITNSVMDFVCSLARKLTPSINVKATQAQSLLSLLENLKIYNGNLSSNLTTGPTLSVNLADSSEENILKPPQDWSYLQAWPPSYDFTSIPLTPSYNSIIISQSVTNVNANNNNNDLTVDNFVDYMLTLSWYKNLIANESLNKQDEIVGVLAIKDSLTKNKIKFKEFSADKISEIHKK